MCVFIEPPTSESEDQLLCQFSPGVKLALRMDQTSELRAVVRAAHGFRHVLARLRQVRQSQGPTVSVAHCFVPFFFFLLHSFREMPAKNDSTWLYCVAASERCISPFADTVLFFGLFIYSIHLVPPRPALCLSNAHTAICSALVFFSCKHCRQPCS